VRIAFEQTGFELDAAGSARAARGLQAALEARPDVELVPIRQPGAVGSRLRRGLARELTWFPLRLPRRARALGVDVLHCPMPLAPPRRHPVPTVVTLGDAIPWTNPRWLTPAHALHARLVLAPALRQAAAVVVPSKHTRSELLRVVRGLDPERVVVTPWGVDERFSPGRGPEGATPYLLAVGTLQPRKNLQAAVAALERLDTDHRLVVVGPRGWHDDALMARLRRDRVEVLGHVSDAELVTLYRGAACLVFPSLSEGFGFPLVEAMACGTPVVCADAGSLPEVAGDAALIVPPHDHAALATAVAAVIADPAPWRERGRARAATFSWARCADQTMSVYREAAARRPRSHRIAS
jgi:glycosyltransferase involved in cell wall biosynthesis